MEQFSVIKDDKSHEVKRRFNHIVGQISLEGESAFDTFFSYVEDLNNLLTHPEGVFEQNQKAYALQEDYNQALDTAKARWEKSQKDLDVGASVIKDLLARKNAFDAAAKVAQAVEVKQQRIDAFANYQDPNESTDSDSPWGRLKQKAIELDKSDKGKRTKQLEKLKLNYQSQGILAKYTVKDILALRKEINEFDDFLRFVEIKFNRLFKNDLDKKIIKVLKKNRLVLNAYQDKIAKAIAWRLSAAKLSGDLHCDDSLYALIKLLNEDIFGEDNQESLSEVQDDLTLSDEAVSHSSDFEDFNEIIKVLRRSPQQKDLVKWLNEVIAKDNSKKENKKLIKVSLEGSWIIPTKFKSIVPKSLGFLPDSWVRYAFFRTQVKRNGFFGWFRKKLMGSYEETAVLINETYAQLKNFIAHIPDPQSAEDKTHDLLKIVQSSAFKSALELPAYIEKEQKRTQSILPAWFLGLLSWVPFVNRSQTYQLFTRWQEELTRAQKIILKKCRVVTTHMMEDFESALLKCISDKSFLAEPSMIFDLKSFVTLYGTRQDNIHFSKMISPRYIFEKFDFLLPKNKKEKYASLDEDGLFAYLHFSNKYGSKAENVAAEKIVSLILQEKFPLNQDDDKQWMKSLNCFLEGKNKAKAYADLMQEVAQKYIAPIGEGQNPHAYRFLKRFDLALAKNWKEARENTQPKQDLPESTVVMVPGYQAKLDSSKSKGWLGNSRQYLEEVFAIKPKIPKVALK